jgi:hypothetical protein
MINPAMNANNQEYSFSEDEIESFNQTKQDFIDGKTTARDWDEIEADLNRLYDSKASS